MENIIFIERQSISINNITKLIQEKWEQKARGKKRHHNCRHCTKLKLKIQSNRSGTVIQFEPKCGSRQPKQIWQGQPNRFNKHETKCSCSKLTFNMSMTMVAFTTFKSSNKSSWTFWKKLPVNYKLRLPRKTRTSRCICSVANIMLNLPKQDFHSNSISVK